MKETKDIILATAYKMFLNNNYEAVTINNIIKEAGITKGGIYHHYSSKEELFKAVIDKYVINAKTPAAVEFSSLNEMIEYTIKESENHIQKKTKNNDCDQILPAQHISLFMAAFKYYPGFTKIGSISYRYEVEKWRSIIEMAIKNGEIRNDLDSEIAAINFLTVGTNVVINALLGGSIEYAITMYAKQLRELYKCIKV